MGSQIKKTLCHIEEEIISIEKKDVKNLICNDYEKKAIYVYITNYKNSLEVIKTRLQNLTLRFNKFLQNQSEVIRSVEQRRTNLTSTKMNKNKRNTDYYSAIPTNDEDDIIDINVSIGNQSTQTQLSNGNKNQYYQDRTSAVQSIEKTMGELASMFTRLSHIIYEQRSHIEKYTNI
jgi:hypothetical protein